MNEKVEDFLMMKELGNDVVDASDFVPKLLVM
jgi:hypothetical protein